ncbi:MAG: Response regulator protein TmoT [Legionellaceae bacterium]
MNKPLLKNASETLINEATVYVIDDDTALCESLHWLIESIGLRVRIYNNAKDFLNEYRPEMKGCLLIDIRMPGLSGYELQDILISQHNRLPVIMMTGHGDIPMAVRALKAGAIDFITKPFNAQYLLEQIQKAIQQDSARTQVPEYTILSKRFSSLTSREKEVLEGVVAGQLNKEIAYDLGISLKTVELHRSHVMQKIQAKSLAELVKFYLILNHTLN